MKPKKEQTVNEMLLEIEMGITYSECMKLNESLWKLPETTYNRYWSEASKRFKARLDAIEEATTKAAVSMEIKALKKAILSKHERQELLSKLATGEIRSWREVVTESGVIKLEYYSAAEAKQNIAELNKMEGDYAPVKKDITSGGEKLAAPTFEIILDNGES